MRFPYHAKDFVEPKLGIDSICDIGANSLAVETATGFAVVERGKRPKPNDLVLIDLCGKSHFARVIG